MYKVKIGNKEVKFISYSNAIDFHDKIKKSGLDASFIAEDRIASSVDKSKKGLTGFEPMISTEETTKETTKEPKLSEVAKSEIKAVLKFHLKEFLKRTITRL